jgi:CRP/FNR family transcriptional regulator, anaerobic regulatory protein
MTVIGQVTPFPVCFARTVGRRAVMIGIETVPTFMQLSERGRGLLARGIVTHAFPVGKTIIDRGQEVSGAYFVLQGRLRVFTYAPNGKEATLYIIDPGGTCILALNSLFNQLAYPAWVETEAPTTVAVVPGPLFRSLFETEKPVQDLTVHTLSTLVFRLMAELEQVHSSTLEQRLTTFLLTNAQTDGVLRMTQADIAGHLGTTREVVARLMGRLAAQHLVDTGRGEVRLLNRDGLSDFARGQVGDC